MQLAASLVHGSQHSTHRKNAYKQVDIPPVYRIVFASTLICLFFDSSVQQTFAAYGTDADGAARYNGAMTSSLSLLHTKDPGVLPEPMRRRYTLMRWLTLAGGALATVTTVGFPPSWPGLIALGLLISTYWALVRYHYGAGSGADGCTDITGDRLRLHPLTYLLLSALLVFALMIVPSLFGETSLWFCVMYFVVIGEASRHLHSASLLKALLVCCVVLITLAFWLIVPVDERLQQGLSLLPLYGGLIASAAGGRYQWRQGEEHAARLLVLEELERSRAELQRVNQELQVYAGTVAELAVAHERNRLAREMHDILGYTLATVVVKAEVARRLLVADPQQACVELDRIQEIARGGLSEVRHSISGLRDATQAPSVWHEVACKFVHDFAEQIHLSVCCTMDPLPECHDPELQVALFRIIQETLTNVARHAQATHLSVTLRVDDTQLTLTIQDDGLGIGPGESAGGFGLRGIRERVELLGGQFVLSSRRGHGTSVIVTLSLLPSLPSAQDELSSVHPSPAAASGTTRSTTGVLVTKGSGS